MTCALRVREHLRPILERAIDGDAGRAPEFVTVGDDLEGKLGLGGVHREDGEVVNDQEFGANEATERALEDAVELSAVQLAEHGRRSERLGSRQDHLCARALDVLAPSARPQPRAFSPQLSYEILPPCPELFGAGRSFAGVDAPEGARRVPPPET